MRGNNDAFFIGNAAEATFRNLRNKYGRERRKLKTASRSGAGASDVNVELSEMFPFLGWLGPYFLDRDTATNFEVATQQNDNIQEDEEDINDNTSVALTPSDISLVTGRAQYRKRARY